MSVSAESQDLFNKVEAMRRVAADADRLRVCIEDAENAIDSMENEVVMFTAKFQDGSDLKLECNHGLRNSVLAWYRCRLLELRGMLRTLLEGHEAF